MQQTNNLRKLADKRSQQTRQKWEAKRAIAIIWGALEELQAMNTPTDDLQQHMRAMVRQLRNVAGLNNL